MTNTNLLYDAWEKEYKLFKKNLNALKTRLATDPIHDLRVCVKKIKAYRVLFYLIYDKESKIKFTETNDLFDILGKLRNIQICLDLVGNYEKNNDYYYINFRNFLETKSKLARQWCGEAVKKYDDSELLEFEQLLKNEPSLEQKEQILKKVNQSLADMQNLADKPHQVRKQIKKVHIWIKTLPDEEAHQHYKNGRLNDVADNLGLWQDHEVLLTEIKYFQKNFIPDSFEEKKQLKSLQKIIPGKKDKYSKDALEDLDFIK